MGSGISKHLCGPGQVVSPMRALFIYLFFAFFGGVVMTKGPREQLAVKQHREGAQPMQTLRGLLTFGFH